MHATAIKPSIGVTIGRQMRLFHAFVTTAPAALDAPSTVALYLATLSGRVRPGSGAKRT